MEQNSGKSANWLEGESWGTTVEPAVSMSLSVIEEAPALTVAAVVGVTLAVLLAIIAVFMLGILIDCRQQKLIAKKFNQIKKPKNQRASAHPGDERAVEADVADGASIVNNMEVAELSVAPAEALRTIP